MTTPILWYLNRGTGVALLVLFTLTVVLGVLSTGRGFTTLWPRFLTQGLHRTLAGLSTGLLLAHALTAVIDEYVDIRWWQAVVPFGATYEPLWLALGTLSLDLTVMVVVTSLLRSRISTRAWFLIHLLSYAAWLAAVVHGLGIGTDATPHLSVLDEPDEGGEVDPGECAMTVAMRLLGGAVGDVAQEEGPRSDPR